MRQFDIVVVIPVGPNTNPAFIQDTIDSFTHYTTSTYKIIVIDDSHQGLGMHIKMSNPAIDVLNTRKNSGAMAGLYITLSTAYAYALQRYDFRILFKLDTDALVTGFEPEAEAMELFAKSPETGIAGQYPLEYNGSPWDIKWPSDRITNATMTWKAIRRPIANWMLRKFYLKALTNGYRTGESVFGGAYFMNRSFLQALYDHRLLPNHQFGKLNLGEDHLFSLMAKALHFNLGDLSAPGLPFACAWKGLPASPAQLYHEGKKIIHSTRNWQEMDEEQVRSYFRQKREHPGQKLVFVRRAI